MAHGNARSTSDAVIFGGLTKGIVKAGSPERTAERSAARLRKEELDQALEQTKATRPTKGDLTNLAETQSLQIEAAETAAQIAKAEVNKQSTFSAFDRFNADNFDVRHLNVMFDNLKASGSTLYEGITRVDTLTEADRRLIESEGLPADAILASDSSMKGTYVKITTPDGKQLVRSVDRLKAVSGYTKYASKEELDRQVVASQALLLATLGFKSGPEAQTAYVATIAKLPPGTDPSSPEFKEEFNTNLQKEMARKRQGFGSANERIAERMTINDGFTPGTDEFENAFLANMADLNARAGSREEREADRATDALIAEGDARDREDIFNQEFDKITTRKARTIKQKDREVAVVAQDKLDEIAGGDFFDGSLDMSDRRTRAKIEPYINAIEVGLNAEFSGTELDTLERINELTELGGIAGTITAEQTGIIDKIFFDVRKLFSDDITGIAEAAAYASYRNVVRHALFGSVLTPGEVKSFKEAFGALTQQVGPILAALKNNLEQVKNNYQTLSDTNNPYVMQYRTGRTGREIRDVIAAIDQRLELISGFKSESVIQPQQRTGPIKIILTPEREAGLDAIFGKNEQIVAPANGLGVNQ